MYDSDFNMRGSFYEESKKFAEESKKLVKKSARKKICPKCGFTTITNLGRCLKCGGKLSDGED